MSNKLPDELITRDAINPAVRIRLTEPIRPNELLYDSNQLAVAIKINGEILPILEGEE